MIDNGIWIIAIEVVDTGGGLGTTETSVIVDGQLKLGRYHITYQDLAVPVGGIPIQVLRTYDTLNKDHVGDFGNGWTLDVSDFRVQINRPLGDGGWERYACGGGIIFVNYCFRTSRSHYVTVTWPDGRTETFDFTPRGLTSFFGAGAIASYTPRAAATSTLEPAGGANLGWTGDGNLYNDPFTPGTLYDPDRFVLVANDGTRYTLDRNDGLIQAEDRNGNTVTIDDLGIHSSNGPDIDFTRDGLGRITSATGPDNEAAVYGYTPAGDLDSVTDPNNHETSFDYVDHALTQITDALGNPFQRLEYEDGRLVAVVDANNNRTEITTSVGSRTQTVTSPDGRQITLSSFDQRGNETARDDIFDGTHHISSRTYSDDGRDLVTSRTDPNNHTWTADYDDHGHLAAFTDAKGQTATLEYDDYGSPTAVVDENGGTVTFDYDTRGNLTTLTDPVGRHRTWTYNSRGDTLTQSDDLDLRRTWTYTSAGRVASMVDALGTTTYGYDSAGRLTSEQRPEGAVTYSYDDGGRMLTMVDPSGTTTYGYDNAGRVTSSAAAAGTITYGYRPDGRRQTMTTPHSTTSYDYDPAGRLSTLTDTLAGVVTFTHSYGGIDTITRPNGVTTDNTYDLAGRLTSIDHAGPSGLIDYFDYSLDPNGNPTTIQSTDGTETYTLDDLDRLTAVTYPSGDTETFAYNPAGDRTESSLNGDATSYEYDAAGRLDTLTSPSGTVDFTWDGNGNLSSTSEGDAYTWTSRNMMATASVGTVVQTYQYDAAGIRVAVDGDAWLWDRNVGLPQLLSDGSSTFLPGLEQRDGGASLWTLTDALGSTRAVSDATGAVTGSADYTVFGTPRSPSGVASRTSFAGEVADPTGLLHLRARQYDPTTGTFLSADSMQLSGPGTQGMSRYGYALGSPASLTDPSGKSVLLEAASLIAPLGPAAARADEEQQGWLDALREELCPEDIEALYLAAMTVVAADLVLLPMHMAEWTNLRGGAVALAAALGIYGALTFSFAAAGFWATQC